MLKIEVDFFYSTVNEDFTNTGFKFQASRHDICWSIADNWKGKSNTGKEIDYDVCVFCSKNTSNRNIQSSEHVTDKLLSVFKKQN